MRLRERVAWFWAEPTDGARAALFRIALGLLTMPTALELCINAERFFGDGGALPWSVAQRDARTHLSLLALAPGVDWLPTAFAIAMLVAGLLLTLGVAARASAFVACVAMVSFAARNPYAMNGGDRLFAILLGLAVLVPLSRRWSVSAWWRARRGRPEGPLPSAWGLRLVQLQVAWMYALTGFAKLAEPRWRSGEVMGDVLSSQTYAEWPRAVSSPALLVAASVFVLLFECAFPVAVFWRRTRALWLVTGVVLHLGIEVFLVIPLFSAATLVSYLAFVTDDEARRLVSFARWWRREGGRSRRSA